MHPDDEWKEIKFLSYELGVTEGFLRKKL